MFARDELPESDRDGACRVLVVKCAATTCMFAHAAPHKGVDPDGSIIDRLKEVSVMFGVAQVEAGADALTFPDHATGDLVSGEYYERYLKDIHTEMVERIPCPLILHICGRTVDRMPFIAETGMASFHFDSKNTPEESMDTVERRISMVGNINNPETLYARTTDEVRNEVTRNLDACVQMVGPECAIPLQTPLDNLLEIPRAVREWHDDRNSAS